MNKDALLAWAHSLPDDVQVSGVSFDHGADLLAVNKVGPVYSTIRTTMTIHTAQPHAPPNSLRGRFI